MKLYRYLLFDLDMTLLDYHATEDAALDHLFHEFGITISPALKQTYKQYNLHRWKLYERGEISWQVLNDHMFDQFLAQHCGVVLDGKMVTAHYLTYVSQGQQLMPGARQLLESLFPRYRLVAVTNGQTKVQWSRMQHTHISQYFQRTFISEAVQAQKPSRQMFDYIFNHVPGANQRNSLMIGDSLTSDIQGGQNAGIDTLWLNWHGQQSDPQPRPTYTATNLGEINRLLIGK